MFLYQNNSVFSKGKYSICDGALAQVDQRGCGISLLGDLQKLLGHGPGQPAVGVPC